MKANLEEIQMCIFVPIEVMIVWTTLKKSWRSLKIKNL